MITKARNGMLIWLQTATGDQLPVCKYSNSNQTHPRGCLHTIPLYTCEDKPSKVPRIPQTLMCSLPKEDHRRWLSSFSLSDTCRLLCAPFRKHNRYQSPLSLLTYSPHESIQKESQQKQNNLRQNNLQCESVASPPQSAFLSSMQTTNSDVQFHMTLEQNPEIESGWRIITSPSTNTAPTCKQKFVDTR